jgi:hypothetical protein
LEAVAGVPLEEQPDFVILQDSLLISGGGYRVFVTLGQPGSQHYQVMLTKFKGDLRAALGNELEVMNLGEHALLCWIIWFSSWLKSAVPRAEMLQKYLPQDYVFGKTV